MFSVNTITNRVDEKLNQGNNVQVLRGAKFYATSFGEFSAWVLHLHFLSKTFSIYICAPTRRPTFQQVSTSDGDFDGDCGDSTVGRHSITGLFEVLFEYLRIFGWLCCGHT